MSGRRRQEFQVLSDEVTVVIAAKNEARSIGDIVAEAARVSRNILVVDGHSHDATADLARRAGATVVQDNGRGKGDALRCAIAHVATRIVVFLDADGSHDPADIPRLVAPILAGESDHVTGSRLIGGSSELHGGFDEFLRLSGSSFITACINRRFGVMLSDSQNGFRAVRTSVLRQLNLRENGTTIEQEMIVKTLTSGYRVTEVPCHEYKRRHGSSHIRLWQASPRYVWSLIRLLCRRRHHAPVSAEAASPHEQSPC